MRPCRPHAGPGITTMASTMRSRGARACLYAALAVTGAVRAASDRPHGENLGQNPAHPVSRFDLRAKYEDLPGGFEATVFEARLEHPFALPRGWTLNARAQFKGWVGNPVSGDNPDGAYSAAAGDTMTQLFLIAPAAGRTIVGFGLRNFFPTAGADQFGLGRWRVAPFVVVQRPADWLPAGSFYGLGLRHESSVGGPHDRPDVDQLQIVPIVTVVLPRQAFVTLFPEIIVDWEHDGGVLVPFDLECGRKYAPDRAVSLRLQAPFADDLDSYDWTLEARWSLFF